MAKALSRGIPALESIAASGRVRASVAMVVRHHSARRVVPAKRRSAVAERIRKSTAALRGGGNRAYRGGLFRSKIRFQPDLRSVKSG